MVITTTATTALEKIYLDIVGSLDTDIEGNKYILTIQCELSKFVEAYPYRYKGTVSVAKSLVNNFILRYGIPKTVATDRGTDFISSTMSDICKLLNIEKLHSTVCHHESIGSLENTHKSLDAYLRIQCDENPDRGVIGYRFGVSHIITQSILQQNIHHMNLSLINPVRHLIE